MRAGWCGLWFVPVLLVVGVLAYSNTFQVPFQFDDSHTISENLRIRDLSHFSWFSKNPSAYGPIAEQRYVGQLSFALNYRFGGLAVEGYHAVNLAIHLLASLLVYALVQLLRRTPAVQTSGASDSPPHVAAFTALLFLCHPVQTQAVTYLSQRFAGLATLFYLAAVVLYLKWRLEPVAGHESRGRSIGRGFLYAGAVAACLLAVRTKEIAFTIPFVLILFEFLLFADGRSAARLAQLIPFAAAAALIPFGILRGSPSTGSFLSEVSAPGDTALLSRWPYFFTQLRVLCTYLRLLVFPANQNLDYDYPPSSTFFSPEVALAAVALAALLLLGIWLASRACRRSQEAALAALGIFWFFGTVSVESSVIPIADVIFEHRLYLPSVGAFWALSAGGVVFAHRLKPLWRHTPGGIAALGLVVVAAFGWATYQRNQVWADETTLWQDVVQKSPAKARGYVNLALAYQTTGQDRQALDAYNRALALDRGNTTALLNRGAFYLERKDHLSALRDLDAAVRISPSDAALHTNRGIALYRGGRIDESIRDYTTAIALDPGFVKAYINRGNALDDSGRWPEALTDFNTALALDPTNADAWMNRGVLYLGIGNKAQAATDFQKACSRGSEEGCRELGKLRIPAP